jgi:diguanylate cyclase (GGDEF)-like protein
VKASPDSRRLKEAIIVPNLDNEPRTCFKPQGSGISSQISMPLITHDRVVGVLNANRNSAQSFTEDDAALVHAIAASIAVAIDHARLFETLEQRVETRTAELAALNQIANVVNRSLDLDALLNATLEELTHTLQLTGAAIALYESDKSTLTLHAQKGFQESGGNESPWSHWNPKLNFDELPNDHTQAFDVEDLKLPLRDHWLSEGMRSFCHVPLSAAGNRIGILGLGSNQKGHFGEAEVRWLTAVGNTIAVAICNAQLYKATEHQVIQLATLRKIDRILYSTLDLAPMLQIVLTSIAQVVSHDFAIVYLLEGTKMRGVAANGINLSNLASYVFETTGDLAYEELIRERKPLVIDDLHPDILHWSMIPNLDKVHSWMGTPLIARETVIGQISLYSATPTAFTSEHSEWVQSFSNHAAVAIANALLRAELSRQASCDSLTQVLNHGRFIEELRDACAHAQAHHEPISLIMLDLDNFKHYNDTYGHVVGDAVLRATVQAIRTHIHQSDLVGRWGGEEFGIALRHANSQRAMQIAERIRKTLVGTPIRDRHGTLIPPPTASQGIASLGETAIDVDDLIEDADRALYLAKNRGRDQVAIATKKK